MCKRVVGYIFFALFIVSGFLADNILAVDNAVVGKSFFTIEQARGLGRGNIIGNIVDRKGEPVGNATILVEPMGTNEEQRPLLFDRSSSTDANGNFRIRFLPVGTYKITAVPEQGTNLLSNDQFNVNVFPRETAVVDMKLSAVAPAGTEYVGSSACKNCHESKHSAWLDSAHAKTHLVPSESSVVAPFDDRILLTSDEKVKFKAFFAEETVDGELTDIYKVTLFDLNDESVSVTYDVARTHGGVAAKGKQRFHVKLNNSHYILPIQYNNHNIDADNPDAAWVSYHPERWYNEDGTLRTPDTTKHSFEQNCEGCHATGLGIEKVSDEFISNSFEIGIGCEECHGPGALHVANDGGDGESIINPEYMTVEAASQICGQCHTRVVSKPGDNGADFETGYPAIVDLDEIIPYSAGNDLNDFLSFVKLSGSPTPGFWNDDDTDTFGEDASINNHSKKHHQQVIDFEKSGHYKYVGLKCFDCHSPHGTDFESQLRFNNDDNSLCLECHPDKREMGEDGETNVHTKHIWDPEESKASRCSGCHLPKTAKSAVFTDIHSHVFDIIEPPISLAMAEKNESEGIANGASTVIMNACFSCHPDEDYGVSRWEGWKKTVVE